MKVYELIAELQKHDPNAHVILTGTDDMDYNQEITVVSPASYTVASIYSGDPAVYITDGTDV